MLWDDPVAERLCMLATPPIVYLDHSPMRQIADNPAQADRLTAALRRGGTLALSAANLIDFANQEDGRSLQAIRRLLRGVGGRVCIINTDQFAYAEKAAQHGADRVSDAFDMPLMQDFVAFEMSRGITDVDASGLVDWTRSWPAEGRAAYVQGAKGGAALIERARQRYREVKWQPRARAGEPRALECAAAFWRVVAREQSGRVEENDAVDLLHAGVSIACCDIVVLDSRWAELVRRVPKPPRLADVFSGKPRERDAFLLAVERHPRPYALCWDGGADGLRLGWT